MKACLLRGCRARARAGPPEGALAMKTSFPILSLLPDGKDCFAGFADEYFKFIFDEGVTNR
jgi:hypothetical protein